MDQFIVAFVVDVMSKLKMGVISEKLKYFNIIITRGLALSFFLIYPTAALADRAYVANYGASSVSVVDTSTNLAIATISVGTNPRGIAVTPNGTRVYVTNELGNSLSVINTATNMVVQTIPVGFNPFGVVVTPDGSRAYVANEGGDSVSVVNTATNTVIRTVGLGSGSFPLGIAVSPDGAKVYVTNSGTNTVSVIDTATDTVVGPSISVGLTPIQVAFSPVGARAYVTNLDGNSVSVINTVTNSTIGSEIAVGREPWGLVVSANGTRVYVANEVDGTVSIIDTTSTPNVVMSSLATSGVLSYVALSLDGSTLYTAQHGRDKIAANDLIASTSSLVTVGLDPRAIAIIATPTPPTPIPTLSQWAMLTLGLLLGGFALSMLWHRPLMRV